MRRGPRPVSPWVTHTRRRELREAERTLAEGSPEITVSDHAIEHSLSHGKWFTKSVQHISHKKKSGPSQGRQAFSPTPGLSVLAASPLGSRAIVPRRWRGSRNRRSPRFRRAMPGRSRSDGHAAPETLESADGYDHTHGSGVLGRECRTSLGARHRAVVERNGPQRVAAPAPHEARHRAVVERNGPQRVAAPAPHEASPCGVVYRDVRAWVVEPKVSIA